VEKRDKSKNMKEDPSPEAGRFPPEEDDSIEILEVVGLDDGKKTRATGDESFPGGASAATGPSPGGAPASGASAAAPLPEPPDSIPFTRQQLYDMLLRKQAEFENARKRAEREREESRRRIAMDLLRDLLPILDNFQRALADPAPDPPDPFRQGVSMTFQQMMDTLSREGLQEIAAVGERFDPDLHEAIESRVVEGFEDGMVLEELRRGYRFQGYLLRPALVRVSGKGESRPGGEV
jgi:molecular chaperone GrpE